MATWTIKSQTNDPDLALEIVADQRNKGYNAWIEDENGAAVDEQSLKMNERVATERTVPGWLTGPLFVFASVAAGFVFLYLAGLLVDHY
jgi:hypothetical protein